jgi:hypothetical protein
MNDTLASLKFAGKVGAYTSEAPNCAPVCKLDLSQDSKYYTRVELTYIWKYILQ